MGKIVTFKSLIFKKGIYVCLETKIRRILTFEKFIFPNAPPSPPIPNKIVLTYVIKLLDNMIE